MPRLRSLFALVVCGSITMAADWPQWLGPNRDASSSEKVAVWKDAPKVVWQQPVGEGHSSPVVADGKVFLHVKVKDMNQEQVLAFDAKTGKPSWDKTHDRSDFNSLFGNGPRATPTVIDGRVYTFGITGVLACWDAKDGTEVWKVDTLKKFEAPNLFFGMSCSPLVEGDKVIVSVGVKKGGKGTSIVAFDRKNGEVVWKSGDDPANYASGIAIGKDRDRQLVFLTGANVVGLNPKDGSSLWKFPLKDALNESSTTPVVAGDLIIASSVTYGAVGLKLEPTSTGMTAREEWKNPDANCYFSTPVAVGKDRLFLVSGTKPPALRTEATLRCLDPKTGKEMWKKPAVGKYHASLLKTGDDKLLMLDDAGMLHLLDPSAKEYTELAKAKVCGETWAHPALSDGRLYIRDKKELICLEFAK
jgi:outer membrane protein assembly factor BamB